MDELCGYQIEVKGQVAEQDMNAMSPVQQTVVRAEPACTLLAIRTDQSGLIGLLRYLHGRGVVLLSVRREP